MCYNRAAKQRPCAQSNFFDTSLVAKKREFCERNLETLKAGEKPDKKYLMLGKRAKSDSRDPSRKRLALYIAIFNYSPRRVITLRIVPRLRSKHRQTIQNRIYCKFCVVTLQKKLFFYLRLTF